MRKRIACFCLLLVCLMMLLQPALVLAQEEEEEVTIVETVSVKPTYRTLEDTAPGASFEYEVSLAFIGGEARDFDLSLTGPQNWTMYITPQYGDQKIGSIRLEPYGSAQKVKVIASPPYYSIPEPGEYTINVEASSGGITADVDLTAEITATYSMGVTPTEERYNTEATAGKDNFYSIVVENYGSGTLENIKLSSTKPSGWTIEFTPDEIDELTTGSFQTIDVNITPDAKAIAGDYEITLAADSKQTTESIDIRVTVETPTIWGWVGIGIILLVIAGVTVIFMRFSRR